VIQNNQVGEKKVGAQKVDTKSGDYLDMVTVFMGGSRDTFNMSSKNSGFS